jgi:hypothetical protein
MLGAVTSNVMDKKIQSLIKNKNRYGTNGNVKKTIRVVWITSFWGN